MRKIHVNNLIIQKNFIRGFTLIELLVVISILAMLASIVITSTTGSHRKARDSRREGDMQQIQVALNLYYSSNRRFPVCSPEIVIDGSSDCLSSILVSSDSVSHAVATDPFGGSTGTCGDLDSFVYCYQSLGSGAGYRLRYHLEGNSVPNKPAGWQEINP